MEEDLNDIKAERDRLLSDSSQLKGQDDKQGWKNTQDEIIKEKETKIRKLEKRNKTLLEEYEKLQKRIEKTVLKEKEEVLEENKKVVEENKKIKEQIEKRKERGTRIEVKKSNRSGRARSVKG